MIRVAVVDDEPLARRGVISQLAAFDDLVLTGEYEDGPTALAGLRETLPDLVFLDVQMPGMNGLEAARRVRQLKPLGGGGPRLVAMSANLPNGTPQGSGFEEFLSKPVQLDSLQDLI